MHLINKRYLGTNKPLGKIKNEKLYYFPHNKLNSKFVKALNTKKWNHKITRK